MTAQPSELRETRRRTGRGALAKMQTTAKLACLTLTFGGSAALLLHSLDLLPDASNLNRVEELRLIGSVIVTGLLLGAFAYWDDAPNAGSGDTLHRHSGPPALKATRKR